VYLFVCVCVCVCMCVGEDLVCVISLGGRGKFSGAFWVLFVWILILWDLVPGFGL
jgi:hypothetical protein